MSSRSDAPVGADEGCPHANCGCGSDPGFAPYCSLYCRNAGRQESLPGDGSPPGACACEHDACTAAQEHPPHGTGPSISTGHS